MSTLTNPLLKTLSFSNTSCCLTSSLHRSPSIFIPKSPYFSIPPLIPNKLPTLYLQKPTYSSTFTTYASEWDQQEGSNIVLEEEQGGAIWDFQVGEPTEDAKLFVGNLSFEVDSEKLAHIFQEAGVVEMSEVLYNRETERSRGFGFVTMSNVEEADKAVEMFNGYELHERLLTVNKAAPRGTRPERAPREYEPSFRVYVGNLPWDVDSARLEQWFNEHREVLNARVVSDRETGRSRGFGFVTMASESEMNDAIGALDGQTLDGRTIRVNVAEDRPQRRF